MAPPSHGPTWRTLVLRMVTLSARTMMHPVTSRSWMTVPVSVIVMPLAGFRATPGRTPVLDPSGQPEAETRATVDRVVAVPDDGAPVDAVRFLTTTTTRTSTTATARPAARFRFTAG